MSHKISQARRAAFLAALAATGNQTLAAERAKVSRSWVRAQRSADAGFDAAVRGALRDAADAAPQGERGSVKPPSGWGFLGGEELVVRSTGGTSFDPSTSSGQAELRMSGDGGSHKARGRGRGRAKGRACPQIARARLHQWSPRVEERFLSALTATCNVKAACAEVGFSPASAYNHRKRWPAFARRWDAAVEIGYAQLECGLLEAGCNLLSGEELTEVAPLRGMTVSQAIHLLHMHKHAVRGIGEAPGKRWQRPKTLEELGPGIIAKLNTWLATQDLDPAGRARSKREWDKRRA